MVVFIDDILIYSQTYADHIEHIRYVFQILDQHQFKVKLSKCAFAQERSSYLGHVISSRGISTNPKKVSDVQQWPTPTCVKEVKGFLGLTGYYRKLVNNFGLISKPLTPLLRKGEVFLWSTTHCNSPRARVGRAKFASTVAVL